MDDVESSRQRRRYLVTAGLLLIATAAILVVNRPGRNAIKTWQAHRHARKAFTLIDQQKWPEARTEATAAIQLRPNDPEALRVVARLLSRTHQAEALEFWRKAESKTRLTREDRRDEATTALAANDLLTAKTAADDLINRNDSVASANDWLLATNVAMARGDGNAATQFAKKVLDDSGADEHAQVEAAATLTRIAGNPYMDLARTRLNEIATKPTKAGLEALVALAGHVLNLQPPGQSQNGAQPLSIDQIVSGLNSHPLSTAWHKLLAFDLQIRERLADRGALITKAIGLFKQGNNEDLVALSNWLNAKGEYEKALETVSLDRALQSHDLFIHRLDALGGLKRWDDIRQLLEMERFPLDLTTQHMYLARCYAEMGQRAAAENNWQRALEFCGRDVDRLMRLGDYAENNAAPAIAEEAYGRAADVAPDVRPAWRGLVRARRALGQTHQLHETLVKMLQRWPNDAAIQNDEAYARLLLLQQSRGKSEVSSQRSASSVAAPLNGVSPARAESRAGDTRAATDLQQIEQLARELVKREPASVPHRTLLALALLREGRAGDALKAYSNLELRPDVLSPDARAVHLAVVQANHIVDEAAREQRNLLLGQLLPEERKLVTSDVD